MSNVTDVVTSLPFIVVMFTLFLTLVGVLIARSSRSPSTKEPWTMIHLENELWLLKRNIHAIATIHGIVVEEPDHIDTPHIEGEGFHFMNATNEPAKYFKYGTSILIRVDEDMKEASFILYYEEHDKRSQVPAENGYHPDMKHEENQVLSSNVKTWTADLY